VTKKPSNFQERKTTRLVAEKSEKTAACTKIEVAADPKIPTPGTINNQTVRDHALDRHCPNGNAHLSNLSW